MNKNLNRGLSTIMAASMLAACITIPAAGAAANDTVKIMGNPVAYDTVYAQFDYAGDKSTLKYQWLKSAAENGTYDNILDNCNAEADRLTLLQSTDHTNVNFTIHNTSESDAVTISPMIAAGQSEGLQGKFVKVKITALDGKTYESKPVQVERSWGGTELKNETEIIGALDKSNPNYVFTVGGQDFILLDTYQNNDTGHYLVMAKDTYGSRKYYMTDENQRPFEMAYWLNSTFKKVGNEGKALPTEITTKIDYNRYWRLEQGSWWHANGNFAGDNKAYRHVSAQGGIMLPAYSELVQYKDKIGLHDNDANWWLRTPCAKNPNGSQADGNWVTRIADTGNSVHGTHGKWESHQIRPIFTLNQDFFKGVKASNIGVEVAKTIRAEVTDAELLAAGYTNSEIETIFNNHPEITNVNMKGIYEYYQTINGETTFANGVAGTGAEHKWLYSDAKDGTYAEIAKDGKYVTDTKLTLVQGADAMTDNNPLLAGSMLLYGNNPTYVGKWIKYQTTLNGFTYASEPKQVAPIWHLADLYQTFPTSVNFKAKTPSENIFEVDGKKFILLDTTESDTSKYFVLSYDDYGITRKGSQQHFEYMSAWLNSDFKASGVLPVSITDNIDKEHYWKVGPRYWGRSNDNENIWYPAVKGGISLLGASEYKKYSPMIGYKDNLAGDWWLRDPELTSGDGERMLSVSANNGEGYGANMTTEDKAVRPAFYLGSDFFKKVTIKGAGSEAIKKIIKNTDEASLIALYGVNYKDIMAKHDTDAKYVDVSMDGIFEYYQTIEGKLSTNEKINTISYQWMYSDTQNGTYAEIAKSDYVKDNKITLVQGADSVLNNPFMPNSMLLYGTNQTYAGKWIKYVVTLNGVKHETVSHRINDVWGDNKKYNTQASNNTYKANTPSSDAFMIGGKTFIMLDTTTSSKSHFYLLEKEKPVLYKITGGQDMTTTMNWLNNDFKRSGNVPEEVLRHVNKEHYWKMAPRFWGRANDGMWNPSIKGGIGLLSKDEYIKYHEKIGYSDGGTTGWWLIDPAIGATEDGDAMLVVKFADGSVVTGAREERNIRPALYVDENFFLDEKIDLSLAGANIINMLKKEYTRSEMRIAGYSEAELNTIFGDDITATSKGVSADGVATVTVTLSDFDGVNLNLFYAIYNESGRLVGVEKKNLTIQLVNGTYSTDLSISGITGTNNTEKVFVWDNEMKNIKKPVTPTKLF